MPLPDGDGSATETKRVWQEKSVRMLKVIRKSEKDGTS